jgi:DNA polymerase
MAYRLVDDFGNAIAANLKATPPIACKLLAPVLSREDKNIMAKPKRAARLEELAAEIRVCTKCPLWESRTLAVPGDGPPTRARVMIIGEAPGREEDESGHPFVGATGRFLDHVLEGTGIDRKDFFITNTVKCRPPKNRTPRKLEVETCTSNYLFEQIELINPRLIVLLGLVAARKMLNVKSINEARGRIIERDGRRFLVGYHPAVRFYREDLGEKVKEDFARLKRELKKL